MFEYQDYRLQTTHNEVGYLSANERQLLRELAHQVKALALQPSQSHKIDLWKKHNALKKVRPMVLAFPEGAWSEMLPYEWMTIKDPFWKSYEYHLRRQIYRGIEIHDDCVIESILEVPTTYTYSGWGMDTGYVSSSQVKGAAKWEPTLKKKSDATKMTTPFIRLDEAKTRCNIDAVKDVLGDVLSVSEFRNIWIDTSFVRVLVQIRGMEQLMLDMVDDPQWVHEVMRFMQRSILDMMDQIEKEGLVEQNDGNSYVGSGGMGYSNELRGHGEIGFINCWGTAASQDYDILSPSMYDEFAVQYQIPILNRYGLNCYGCCESLNQKFDIVKKIPRLRRVSVSPWTDPQIASKALEDKYILSWKPNPAQLVEPYDIQQLKCEIERVLETTKGCVVEMILKDTHTVENHPERIRQWVDIAQKLADNGYS